MKQQTESTAPLVVMAADQLSAIITSAVREALEDGAGQRLLDKQQLAHRLGCSAAHIDHLRKRGLPTVRVGQVVRFEMGAVLPWLREHGGA